MSMQGVYQRINPAILAELRKYPNLVEEYITVDKFADMAAGVLPQEALAMLDQVPEEQREALRKSMEDQFASLVGQFDTGRQERNPALPPRPQDPELHIDKAWHGLHFVLCGTADSAPPPLGNAVLGGVEIGPDIAYGPCRFLAPEQVASTAAALASISVDDFRRRYDADALAAADIYGGAWSEDPEEIDWLVSTYTRVSDYFQAAAQSGQAMLLYLT